VLYFILRSTSYATTMCTTPGERCGNTVIRHRPLRIGHLGDTNRSIDNKTTEP
jgi:hypothetical protein